MRFFRLLCGLGAVLLHLSLMAQTPSETTVFVSGEEGYACFRIPAIVRAPSGKLLAFAEARRLNCGDFGDVDIVLKTSTDEGRSWGKLRIVADAGTDQAGNPAPVFDLLDPRFPSGRLFLLYNTGFAHESDVREGKGVREVIYVTSEDEGITWSPAVMITKQVHFPNLPSYRADYNAPEDWRSYANTPGHALQLTGNRYRGRLLVAANHSAGTPQPDFQDYQAHAFFSDDHGATWQLSNTVAYKGSNESTAAELADGSVLMNMRDQSGYVRNRLSVRSTNGGRTWGKVTVETTLPDPVCQGSILSFQTASGAWKLYFSNLNHQKERKNLTLYEGDKQGRKWKAIAVVEAGSSAYSDLVLVSEGSIGVLYEAHDYSRILFKRFRL